MLFLVKRFASKFKKIMETLSLKILAMQEMYLSRKMQKSCLRLHFTYES